MGDWSDRIVARLRDRIENEADSIGVEMTADIRANISTPVIRDSLGNVVVRSPPFEYPWLETGHLRSRERHEIESASTYVQLNVINDAAYARRLHDGHGNVEPRPFHDIALIEWRPQFRPRMVAAITGRR